jgi:hypothetical protein
LEGVRSKRRAGCAGAAHCFAPLQLSVAPSCHEPVSD